MRLHPHSPGGSGQAGSSTVRCGSSGSGWLIRTAILGLFSCTPCTGLAAECSLSAPAACTNTNELVTSPGFFESLVRFVGPGKSSYVYQNANNYNQVMGVLGGSPEARRDIDGGSSLFTSCRPHDCDDKGALIAGSNGGIEAASVLHSDCLISKSMDCPYHQTLTIFAHHPLSPSNMSALSNWARSVTNVRYPDLNLPSTTLKIETVISSRGSSRN